MRDKKIQQILTMAICLFLAIAGLFLQYKSNKESENISVFDLFREKNYEYEYGYGYETKE